MKKLFYFLPFLYLLFLLAHVELALSQDLGRHIRLGEIILTEWHIPSTNLFSYTMPENSFLNHHWLPEIVFYLLSSVGGIEAIIFWKILFVVVTFAVLFFLGSRLSGTFWASVLSFPFLFILSYRFDARPEIFSFLYLSLFLLFIYLFSERRSWWFLLALLPVQILWVNSHIYFFVGMVVYGAFVLSEFILGSRDWRLIGMGVLLLFCMLVTPHGVLGALVPFTIFSDYGYTIVENQSILFLNSWFFIPQVLVFEILSLLLIIFGAFTFSRKYLFWYILSLFGVGVSFAMVRNLPLFVILSFPLACIICARFEKKYLRSVSVRPLLMTLLVIVVGIHVVRGVTLPAFGYFYIEPGRGAVDFIEEHSLEGPIFNNFDIGSYLIYRLYPGERVFVDGRPEAYSVEFFQEYMRMQEDSAYFAERARRYGFQMIVFSTTDITPWGRVFLRHLGKDDQWVRVYTDPYYIVYVPQGSENFTKLTN